MRHSPVSTVLRLGICLLFGIVLCTAPALAKSPEPATSFLTEFFADLPGAGGTCTAAAQPAGVEPFAVARSEEEGCESHEECPKGLLCCLPCGFPDCGVNRCMAPYPEYGGCPVFP